MVVNQAFMNFYKNTDRRHEMAIAKESNTQRVNISIDKAVLRKLDNYNNKHERGRTRSQIITQAVLEYINRKESQ